MKPNRNTLWLLTALALGLFIVPGPAGGAPARDMTPAQRLWLEDVAPIITPTERDVFIKLGSDAERDKFIAFFWRMRDSSPDTPENEFMKEHMDRVRFADRNFGHESPKRGSQTERGFFYVLLGPPLERRFFTTQSELWPLELWFYKGAEEYGLPAYFYLLFYQPQGLGDFRLYYPGVEGPEKLVVPNMYGGGLTRANAVQTIRKINSELAAASQSYLPGERTLGIGSSSENIIASIRQVPEKKFSDAYARTYLTFKDFIETEYSDRYLESAFQVKVFVEAGQPFLHWAIEPEKMSFAAAGDEVRAAFSLVLRLEDSRGRTILEKTEDIPLRLTADQYRAHARQRFAFQDMVPVIPGDYRALFLLTNKTARDFSSYETRIEVPGPDAAGLSVPILFHGREDVPEARKRNLKAFTFGGAEYLVGARNEFLRSESLGVYCQAWNLDSLGQAGSPSFLAEITPLDNSGGPTAFPLEEAAPGFDGGRVRSARGEVPLSGIPPGYYRVDVSAVNGEGRKVLTNGENLIVLPGPAPVVPWVYARIHGPFPGPEHMRALGGEYFMAGEYRRTLETLGRAPELAGDPAARLLEVKALYGLGRFRESLDRALPLHGDVPDRETAKVIALDYASLKDWASALTYLEGLLGGATEIGVLNLAAECQLNLGRPERALPLLQKSLALLPGQPAIKALEEKTRAQVEKK